MNTDGNDLFTVVWAGNCYVRVKHEWHEYEFPVSSDRKKVGDCWITPAAAFLPQLDPEQSLSDAVKHSRAARAAAERFLNLGKQL